MINDYIVLCIFNYEKIGLEKLVVYFLVVGYKECGEYYFEVKKLYVKYFEYLDFK